MKIVDANVVLRYILGDHEELSDKSRRIIDDNIVEIPVEVLCEVVFVLSNVYNVGREKIGLELLDFFENTECELYRREGVLKGIEFYSENNLDFVDCMLAGYKTMYGAEIFTFDKKLLKFIS